MAASRNALSTYESKRDFSRTREPKAGGRVRGDQFVVQHHWATREHYDFRLELDGVLLSWAVTRGPSYNPADKRLAVRTEDHPIAYAGFEGTIPKGEYGGGTVQLWDRGTWQPQEGQDPRKGIRSGMLKFILHGERMKGRWALVRMKKEGSRENWLLIKERDEHARTEAAIEKFKTSVTSGRSRKEIENGRSAPPRKEKRGSTTRARPPKFIAPMLCELHDEPPTGQGWLHETKYDGYRLEAAIDRGKVVLYTREGLDWTKRFPEIATSLSKLGLERTILDGEAVVFDRKGLSNFTDLVEALKTKRGSISYVAFDVLKEAGKDLRRRALRDRKERLSTALADADGETVRIASCLEAAGDEVFRKAVEAGAEGIVSKRVSSLYESRRSSNWIKTKADRRDDFVIVGYLPSERRQFSSLLAAREQDGKLAFSGGVGTGFDQRVLADTLRKLKLLERKSPPQSLIGAGKARRGARWLEPRLRAEIEYHGWTADGQLRHARFLGWREDRKSKGPDKIMPPPRSSRSTTSKTTSRNGLDRITHPDRVVFPEAKVTKLDVASYYVAVADRILPHLKNRPVSFLRAPEGVAGETFFQRHLLKGMKGGIAEIPDPEKEHADYVAIEGVEGLVTAAQFGVVELHGWGATVPRLQSPDRVVFDLDPDPSVKFEAVREAALQLRRILSSIELKSVPLLSGGKGVHVIVPLDRTQDWDTISEFAAGLARGLAEADPARYVAEASKAKRRGRIYIDWLRNRLGASAIVPWSLRARPGATVAVPVSWPELERSRSASPFDIAAALKRRDPWRNFFGTRQKIPKGVLDALVPKSRKG